MDYQNILTLGKETRVLSSIQQLLEWDQETYMPKGGSDFRSEQLELISSKIHREKTSEPFKIALSKLIDLESGEIKNPSLDDRKKAALREWRRDFLQNIKLPNDFVKECAKTTSQAVHIWIKARNENNFSLFAPHLEKIIALMRKKADLLGFEAHPYDPLIDLYEPGITTENLISLFSTLKPLLKELAIKYANEPNPNHSFIQGNFNEKDQLEFNHFILEKMGMDFSFSRLDHSAHPFCLGIHPHDVRITTTTSTSDLMVSLGAILHEGGHALYELGLPVEELGSPLSEYTSIGIHESQSRLWETFIGLSFPFWQFALPHLQKKFPELGGITLPTFYKGINHVHPSFIRIHADEVTYVLHIILRFEIELEFITGKLSVYDLPDLWNAKMKEYLGIVPQTDSEGCLQDIHWATGLFGYFPTYALGTIYAGQIFDSIHHTFPNWKERIAAGDPLFIKQFLFENIYRFGRQYSPAELIKKMSGQDISPIPYMNYLKEKFISSN